MNIHARIIKNLAQRIYPVNTACVLRGIDDYEAGIAAIHELMENGRIRREDIPVPGSDMRMPAYRMGFVRMDNRPRLVVDNTQQSS